MSDPAPQQARSPEETEAALARMPTRIATILRRRFGLAPAEPQTSAIIAEICEKLANLDPTARVIDPGALKWLDAEIAAKAEREAAEQAKSAQPASANSTAEQDPAIVAPLALIKARARRLSPVKRRLEVSAVKIGATLPDEVLFQHTVFCQTVLPYRDPGPDVRVWERQQGQVTLSLEPGRIRGPEGRHIPVGLPFGVYARRALLYLNTEALRTRDRTIDVDGGVTAFTRRMLGRAPNGREIHHSKDALSRLAGCNVSMSYDAGPCAAQVNAHIYAWLAQRLHRVDPQRDRGRAGAAYW